MEQHLFQLSLYLLPKSGELRLRASDLPSLKVLLQKDGTQPGLELLAGSSSSEQTMRTTNLSWQRQAVGAGSGGAKVPRVPKDPGSGYGQTSLSSFYKMPHPTLLTLSLFPIAAFCSLLFPFPIAALSAHPRSSSDCSPHPSGHYHSGSQFPPISI